MYVSCILEYGFSSSLTIHYYCGMLVWVVFGFLACPVPLLHDGVDLVQHGWTPVYIAAQEGQKECLELLLDRGADKDKARNVSDPRNSPPLLPPPLIASVAARLPPCPPSCHAVLDGALVHLGRDGQWECEEEVGCGACQDREIETGTEMYLDTVNKTERVEQGERDQHEEWGEVGGHTVCGWWAMGEPACESHRGRECEKIHTWWKHRGIERL